MARKCVDFCATNNPLSPKKTSSLGSYVSGIDVKTQYNGYVVVTGYMEAYVLVSRCYKAKLRHRLDPTIITLIFLSFKP